MNMFRSDDLDADGGRDAPEAFGFDDPLDCDSSEDASIVSTHRGLIRLALVAAETGARFQRDGIGHDPMAWMLAPRRLFEGGAALFACLERKACIRALLVHGLGLALDADPADIDRLSIADKASKGARAADVDEGLEPAVSIGEAPSLARRPTHGCPSAVVVDLDSVRQTRKLYTSVIVDEDGGGTLHAFCAMMAANEREMRSRLSERHGAWLAEQAEVVPGFRAGNPIAVALVSDAMAYLLQQIDDDPDSPLGEGLDVALEQRFVA